MTGRPVIAFLTDNIVPDSVGVYLRRRGHDIVRVRDIMASNSADPIVAEAAMRDGRVLVSWDRDFFHQRFMKPRFKSLERLAFSCAEPDAVKRLKAVIDRVEFEHSVSSKALPLLFKIGKESIQIRC